MAESRNIVLVVDDEQAVVRTVTMTLAGAGYRAIVAENGIAGLESYSHLKDQICLVITDFIMPVMDGQAMSDAIRAIDPTAKILLMSGYSDSVLHSGDHVFPVIRKPFLPVDLLRKIADVLADAASA
jgi:CheY-like chemotaxis protein